MNDQIKFSIEASKIIFEALFDKAISAVPVHTQTSVLKNFLLIAEPGSLRVITTDLQLSVLASTQAVSVMTPGRIMLPAWKVMEILRQTKDGQMRVTAAGSTTEIVHGGTTWNLRLPIGDYPSIPDVSESVMAEVSKDRFISAILGVRKAAGTDIARQSLLMINICKGKVTACDGNRLQQVSLGEFPLDLRIPIMIVDDLLKLLKYSALETISVGQTVNHLIFRVGSDTIMINKLTAQFAPVEELLLKPAIVANKELLIVNRRSLMDAVKRVRITADPSQSAIVLDLAPNEITVTSHDTIGNGSWERVDAVWKGKDRQVVVNHQYLFDLLTMYEGEVCSFYLGTDTKTKKSAVLLRDPERGTIGVFNQQKRDWVS